MFLRRPDSFDGSFTLVSCAHVLFHISYVIEGGCPGGTSCSARISTALPKPLVTWHISNPSQVLSPLRQINTDRYGIACGCDAWYRIIMA
jgi:hypothetical protein